jgi:O6-methylguanine-DNA--protein-cysteine methyltransferase
MTAVSDCPRMRIATPLGVDLLVEASGGKIVASRFARRERRQRIRTVRGSESKLLLEAKRQVDAYFAGKLMRFRLPLAFVGKAFECDVWRCVASLGFREFVSYADVARAVGRPLAHRGVARAMRNLGFDLFVPAQRVIGADGRPRGISPGSLRMRLITFERTGNIQSMPSSKKSNYWSGEVTEKSNALDLEEDVFKQRSAKAIAQSLKRSAERSKRRKASSYQSAMSMLNFYINRAGKNLPASRKETLERAKDELRKAFGR